MRVLREWVQRFLGTIRPARRDDELAEELRLHLELVAEDARRRGHDPDEAMRLAQLEAGGRAQAMDAMRDQRGLPWLEDLGRDAVYGLRTLKRHPGFTATAMLSLALGVGANAGIFSLVDQVLLSALPVREPERLVLFDWNGPPLPGGVQSGEGNLISYPFCRDLEEHERFFDGVFCRHPGTVNLSAGSEYERVRAELVSGSYFGVLGIRPSHGRLIDASDDQRPGEHPVVVLSYEYWRNRLGAPADIVGRRVLVNRHPMTVIGVAAAGFRGMDVVQPVMVWVPAMMARAATIEFDRVLDRRAFWMHGFARLQPGVEPEQAEAALQPWFASVLEAETRREGFPKVSAEQRRLLLATSLDVVPAAQGWSSLRQAVARPLWALLAGTTLLLVLACLNVASLLLARGAERSHEITTRMALGASRGRIARQLLAEGLIVALAGGLLGLAAAPLVSRLLLLFLPQGMDVTPAIDLRLIAFALVSAIVAGVSCSLAPAMQAARRPLTSAVGAKSTAGAPAVRVRKLIVGTQLALTLVLLAAAGLFVQTATRLYTRDRGFDSDRLLMFGVNPAGTGSTADAPLVLRNLLAALRATPGVENAAIANNPMLDSLGPGRLLTIEANPRIALDRPIPMMRVSPGFFATVGVRLLAGREFDARDVIGVEKTGYRSLVVNETFARRYFGESNPVGRRVGFSNLPGAPLDAEIVGVIADFQRRYLRDDFEPAHIFVPFAEEGPLAGDGTFYVRARDEPVAAFAAVRAAVSGVDPALPLLNLTTLEDQVGRRLRSELMLATLSSSFGTVALLLSVVGLFGVMSFVVTQRTQEIGMRMALGATRSTAIWLVVRDALATIGAGAGAGLAIGAIAGAQAAPWLSSVLYGVTPSDAATLALTTSLLAGVALAACVVPAGRAAVLTPMAAIRDQQESAWAGARRTVRKVVRELTNPGEGAVAGPVTLIGEFTGLVQRAESFPEAFRIALSTLRDRTRAESIEMLEKTSAEEYRGEDCTIPASGVLINRLTHYRHPLPLTDADFETWLRWAREFRPDRVREIETLRAKGVRLAAALRTKNEVVGVLLLRPARRDAFTEGERQLVGSAAEVFALMLENGRLNDRVLEQEKVRRDLALAAEVQRRLLPPRPPCSEAATLAAFSVPARAVGGDFYDFVDLPEGGVGIAVADIAGKGIAAALLTSAVQASLRVISAEGQIASSHLAAKMNGFLYRSSAANNYATFFYAQIDAGARRMRYVNAGHNPPYLVRRTAAGVELAQLRAGGTVLGLFPDAEYEDGEIDLRPGDLFVAFTDGVTEARNALGEEFGEARLEALLRAASGATAEDVASLLAAQTRAWIAGAEQYDDLTFVIARISETHDG